MISGKQKKQITVILFNDFFYIAEICLKKALSNLPKDNDPELHTKQIKPNCHTPGHGNVKVSSHLDPQT